MDWVAAGSNEDGGTTTGDVDFSPQPGGSDDRGVPYCACKPLRKRRSMFEVCGVLEEK